MKTITYLGRPELIAADEDGNKPDDLYVSSDGARGINLAVGDSAVVSDEKAAQVEADFPKAFEIADGDKPSGKGRSGKGKSESS